MSVPTESITQERLADWTKRLSEHHSTPLLLVGVGHDHLAGQLLVLTPEEITDELLEGALKFALQQLQLQRQ